MNPLYNLLGGNQSPMMNQGPMRMINEFTQFAQQFRGDPRVEVQKLLQSGRMSQQQLNELQQAAHQFSRFFGR